MSDVKAPKKAETVPKKTEAPKSEAPKSDAAKTETTASGTAAAESSAKKSEPSPKSASQGSISHFSSVSTPQYRSGWDSIFGGGKDAGKPKSSGANGRKTAKKLVLEDADIDGELRILLDAAVDRLAKKNGIGLGDAKNASAFEYKIDCKIV